MKIKTFISDLLKPLQRELRKTHPEVIIRQDSDDLVTIDFGSYTILLSSFSSSIINCLKFTVCIGSVFDCYVIHNTEIQNDSAENQLWDIDSVTAESLAAYINEYIEIKSEFIRNIFISIDKAEEVAEMLKEHKKIDSYEICNYILEKYYI